MESKLKEIHWTRCASVALLRWGLGLLLIFAAVGKFYYQGRWSFENAQWFVNGYLLEDKLRESFLPRWLIAAFGYCLPYIEVTLGGFLIAGVLRNCTVFAAAILFIILTIGAFQAKEWSFVLENFFYIYVCYVLLARADWDLWVVRCRCKNHSKIPA
ncbi:MAG: hypothetical protein N2487_05140 [Verrucomicrobiae bacterium]|nr:hypothetical protein [Verrucomicrobiae bacterium]